MVDDYNILLIDDDEVDQMTFIRALKVVNPKYKIKIANTSSEGINILTENTFDCIFIDYLLPGTTGVNLLKIIKDDLKIKTPVVIVTSHGDEIIAVDTMKAGAADYLTKNLINPEGLSQTIRNIIRLQEAENNRIKAEDELKLSQERLAEAQKIARLGNWQFNMQTKEIKWSAEVYNIFEVDENSFTPAIENIKNFIHPEDINDLQTEIKKAETPFDIDFRLLFKNNKTKFVNIKGYLSNINNNYELIGTVQDVTTHKQAEAELKKAITIAEKLVMIKQEFLANMSHEIRTPLNAIIGFSDLLFNTQLTNEQMQYLKAIKNSGDILLVIINDILDTSKIEAGKLELIDAPFNLIEKVNYLNEVFSQKAAEKNIEFEVIADENIPEFIIGDQVRINQILLNLLSNAIKFTERGKVSFKIKTENYTNNKITLYFEINDTGIGIPVEKLKNIFDPFTQLNNQHKSIQGTGLGLSIVKRLLDMMNSHIEVKSQLQNGSTFSFSITFEVAQDTFNSFTNNNINLKINPESLKGLNALLVEDNFMNKLLAEKVLQNMQINVTSSENGKEALEQLEVTEVDIILMDVQMPVMDGYEATIAIRNHNNEKIRNLPILAMTAKAIQGDEKKCLEAGMDDYINKPFEAEDLYNKIYKLINKKAGIIHNA